MSGEQIGQCRTGAAVRHVNQIDARHHLEPFAGHMAYATVANRGHADLAGLALARAINSRNVLAGTDGFASRTWGCRVMLATGTMSRIKFEI